MSRILVISKKQLKLAALLALIIFTVGIYLSMEPAKQVVTSGEQGSGDRVIHMVTGEFKSITPDGKEIESYRWDPGTIFVNKGEQVKLSIHGINGVSHPFIIEGLDVRGEVKKGEETIVTFKASKRGIYQIICQTHSDKANNGPMIGYIIVN